jgi:putative transcriptional regulator
MKLRGSFLIAMPDMLDPNFQRSVVVILDHNEQGCVGLVVNRPSRLPMAEFAQVLEVDWVGAEPALTYVGGPVQRDVVWLLHGVDEEVPGSQLVVPGISYALTRDALEALAVVDTPKRRVYRGYAGWGPGQLEAEIRQGAWLTREAEADLVYWPDSSEVWERALRRSGIEPHALVAAGGYVH